MIILGTILLLFPGSVSVNLKKNRRSSDRVNSVVSETSLNNQKSAGYRSVINYNDGFIAVGSDGRIDWISVSGKIIKSITFPGENFNCVLADNKMIIAAGDKGILRISNDGEVFRKINPGSERNINSLAIFNGTIIAGADKGVIITGDQQDSFNEIKLNLRGNIVSVSSRTTDCYGVTDKGEIIHSVDGIKWDIIDFNQVYAGYYKPCYFTKVLATENRIAVAGVNEDGSPVLMFSSQGKVWTERPLNYTDDQGMTGYLADMPNDMFYDDAEDQFFLACSRGKLMKLPSCSHCNKLEIISTEDLTGISSNENRMMIVGEDFYIKTINLR